MLPYIDCCIPGDIQLRLTASPEGLRSVEFAAPPSIDAGPTPDHPLLREAVLQLQAYFDHRLRAFDLPLDMQGTPFQKAVWQELGRIPYGETRNYAQIAGAIGIPTAVRAVGAANGANPVAIVVPCHRVIGSSGKLVGYGGGLALKQRLLELEGSATGVLFGSTGPVVS
jgi:methylated-DNA-[protein]-cysteine S-methyltransferase